MTGTPRAYTPSREDPEVLDRRTAGRATVLESLDRVLRAGALTQNRPHILIVGPRGAGKSHVIEVALHRMRQDPAVADQLRIARLPEDALGISSAGDILLEVVRSLDAAEVVNKRAVIARRNNSLVELQTIVQDLLGDGTLVLVIENFDRIMSVIGLAGQHELRAWVEQSAEVMVLASAPLLFHAVQNRNAPWFGSFEVVHLHPLKLEEGIDLVANLAGESANDSLAEFVRTQRGRDRLAVVHHLAGGSPRIWTIFAGCLQLDQLDDLVPAVETLLENLVPYYQHRMWELAPTEQKILDTLARGASSATVKDVADAAGVQRDTTASSLQRLAEAGWVRNRKAVGTDQRQTWYEVAEPLLRHHLQYRDTHESELALIVELLQVWFDRPERQKRFLEGQPKSTKETYLASTLTTDPERRIDDAYAQRNINNLEREARLWTLGHTRESIGSVSLGRLILSLIEELPLGADTAARQRLVGESLRNRALPPGDPARFSLRLMAICWDGTDDPALAANALRELLDEDLPSFTANATGDELAFWLTESGDIEGAFDTFAVLIAERTSSLGAAHPRTLSSRHSCAGLRGQAGDFKTAISEYDALIADARETLGPTHPHTLTSRHNRAYWLGRAGEIASATSELRILVPDRIETLGAVHSDTLASRLQLANLLDRAGDSKTALEELRSVIDDLEANHDTSEQIAPLLAAGQIVVRGRMLHTSQDRPNGLDSLSLLKLVAMQGDASAFAALPIEVRGVLQSPSPVLGT